MSFLAMSAVGHLPPDQKLKRGEVLLQYTRVLDQPDYTPVPFHKQQVKTIKADLSWSFTKLMKKIHKHDGGAEPPHHIKEMLFDVAQEEKRKKDELEAAKKAFKDRFTGVKGLSRFGHEVKKPSEEDEEDTDTDGMSSDYTTDATSDADSSQHSEQSDAEQSHAEQSEAEDDAYEPPAAPPSPPAVPAPDPEEPIPEAQAEAEIEPGSGSPVEEQPAEEAAGAEEAAAAEEQPQAEEQAAPEAEAEVAEAAEVAEVAAEAPVEPADDAPAVEEAAPSEEPAAVEPEAAADEVPVESEAAQPEEVAASSELTGNQEAAALEPEVAAPADAEPDAEPEAEAVAAEATEATEAVDESSAPSADAQPSGDLVNQLQAESGTGSEKGPSRRRSLQASKGQLESEAAHHTPSASPLPVSDPINRRGSYNPDANEGESAFADGMIVGQRRSSLERRASQTRSRPTSGIVRAAASLPQSTHNSRPTSATIAADSTPQDEAPIQVARTASRPSSGSYKAKVLTSRPSSDANATRLSRRNSGVERTGSSLGTHAEVEEKEEKGDKSNEAKVPTEEEEKQANAATADPVVGQEFDYDAISAEQAANPDGGFLKPTAAEASDEPDERKIIAGSVLVAEDDEADEVISAEDTIERTGPKPYGFLPFLKLSRNGFTKEVRFPGFGDKYINPPIGWLREKYRFAAPAGVHAFVTLHAYGYVIYAKNNIRF